MLLAEPIQNVHCHDRRSQQAADPPRHAEAVGQQARKKPQTREEAGRERGDGDPDPTPADARKGRCGALRVRTRHDQRTGR
jgi:hypothetical protein